MSKINKSTLTNQEKLQYAHNTMRNVIQRIEYSCTLIDMVETINFYSDELPATIEHQAFFKSLAEHYYTIKDDQQEIIDILKREIA